MTIYINGFKASKKDVEYLKNRVIQGKSKAIIKRTKKNRKDKSRNRQKEKKKEL